MMERDEIKQGETYFTGGGGQYQVVELSDQKLIIQRIDDKDSTPFECSLGRFAARAVRVCR